MTSLQSTVQVPSHVGLRVQGSGLPAGCAWRLLLYAACHMAQSELVHEQVAKLLTSLRTQTASAQTPEAALALGCLLADDINHERSTLSSAIAGLQALLASSDALVQQVRSRLMVKITLPVVLSVFVWAGLQLSGYLTFSAVTARQTAPCHAGQHVLTIEPCCICSKALHGQAPTAIVLSP